MGDVSSSQERSRAEIAEYLREFADELDSDGARHSKEVASEPTGSGEPTPTNHTGGGKITVVAGNESATINPPETLTFDVEVGSDSSLLEGSSTERSATFSLRWNEDHVEEDDELSVQ